MFKRRNIISFVVLGCVALVLTKIHALNNIYTITIDSPPKVCEKVDKFNSKYLNSVENSLDHYEELVINSYEEKESSFGWKSHQDYQDLLYSLPKLKQRIEALGEAFSPSTSERIVLSSIKLLEEELQFRQHNPNQDLWGILGSFKSKVYANPNPGIPKCNLFVAESIYNGSCRMIKGRLDILKKKAPFLRSPSWKWLPPLANEWGNPDYKIDTFRIREDPKEREIGDIWSNDDHVGIFLGDYRGKRLYISARELGIEIKFLPEDQEGVFRYYVGK
jgi:hypothetical protein